MRKEVRISIEDDGTKLDFVIRQMSASQLEWWIFRAVQCVGSALQVNSTDPSEVWGALSKQLVPALASVNPDKAKELLDEMLGTASRVVNGTEMQCTPDTVDGYIGDVRTLFKLRIECLKANLSFFQEGVPSASPEDKGKKGSPIIKTSAR